jgi:hypothetical protein
MRETRLGQELIAGLKEAVAHARGASKLRWSAVLYFFIVSRFCKKRKQEK